MKTKTEINTDSLQELSLSESLDINGGDKFMTDLGFALGYAWGLYKDAATYLASQYY